MITIDTTTRRGQLIQIYSDFHKDAYGFRPRGVNYHEFTLEELEADFDRFEQVCEENRKEQEQAYARAEAEFEARVQSIIDMGAGDRKTALRWIVDSYEEHDLWYGAEGIVWNLGVGGSEYGRRLEAELKQLVAERMAE